MKGGESVVVSGLDNAATVAEPSSFDLFAVRASGPDDLPFVRDSWLTSNAHSPQARGERGYYRRHKVRLNAILQDPGTTVLVACASDAPGAIVGWAVTAHRLVHYVYIRREAQRLGLARLLLGNMAYEPATYTHRLSMRPAVADMVPVPATWDFDCYLSRSWWWNQGLPYT